MSELLKILGEEPLEEGLLTELEKNQLAPTRMHRRVPAVGDGHRPAVGVNKVIEDPTIWPFVSSSMRKTLGIEIEAAALGALANLFTHRTSRIDALVMKGVMDLTNDDRDDQFKDTPRVPRPNV